jgi:hypothetical protein
MAKKSNSSVVHGQHRSFALAERHRRELGKNWRISSRRNAQGELSARGHFFTFTRKRRKKKKLTEYQINVAYEAARASSSVQVQISAKGPSGKNRDQVIKVVEKKMANSLEGLEDEESDPRGWELHIVFWEKKGKRSFGDDALAWQRLNQFFRSSEREVSKNGKEVQ